MRGALLLAAALAAVPAAARAQAVVTKCATDTQPGGMNLNSAIMIGGKITFQCGGPATIRITRSHQIVRATQIHGDGRITLDGQGVNRPGIFRGADQRVSLALVDLNIVNGGSVPPSWSLWTLPGKVVGGSLTLDVLRTSITRSDYPIFLSSGSVRIRRSQFSHNTGVTVNAPTIDVLDGSQFSFNDTPLSNSGGRVVIDESNFWSNYGPSRFYQCALRIGHSHFTSNTGDSKGGALVVTCDAIIEESEFRNNGAASGGAIAIGGTGRTVSLRAVKFHDNVATFFGGAIHLQFDGQNSQLQLRHVIFDGNRAGMGGGIYVLASTPSRPVSGVAVAFLRNRARGHGGAIRINGGGISVLRGVFVDNSADKSGGAIAASSGSGHVVANSLIVRNKADSGGAFWGDAVTFVNTTIADNGDAAVWAQVRTPSSSGGAGTSTLHPIRFHNTIVEGGFIRGCGPAVASSPYQSLGHNLQFPGSSCGADITSAYPALGLSYVPLFFSAALNAGDDVACAATPISRKDVYNVRRPLRTSCTIGAVEGNVSHMIHRWRRGREGGLLR